MLELLLRITVSLLVVFGLMWGLARLARRPLGGGRGGSALAVLARQQLGRSSAVAVVRVVDRALVLGVTDNQITLLGEADLAAVQAVTGAPGARRGAVPGTGAPADRGTGDPPTGTDLLARDAAPADPASPVHPAGGLAGSVLSPATWRQAIEFLRERTVRR